MLINLGFAVAALLALSGAATAFSKHEGLSMGLLLSSSLVGLISVAVFFCSI
ncbi:MAG: hypothetical protein RUMPE_00951 [Eubacteriales bacterium SKADARSKE-1]|nr:hypothetical protein [Eubacteriales bacterium SKADARSKE-1]